MTAVGQTWAGGGWGARMATHEHGRRQMKRTPFACAAASALAPYYGLERLRAVRGGCLMARLATPPSCCMAAG